MRILSVTAHPHFPQISGGSQSSTHELAQLLIGQGHEVAVLSGLYHKDLRGWRNRLVMKASGRRVLRDDLAGYPTYRRWFVWEDPEATLAAWAPDVVMVTAGKPALTAAAFARCGVPLAVYLRDVEFDRLGGDLADLPGSTVYLANSEFTAARYRAAYGIDPVAVPPLFIAERYRTDPAPRNVTFINPHPSKGRDIAFDIAERCPDIPFVFVEGWPLDARDRRINAERMRRAPNVTLHPRVRDMRPIYAAARMLLIPSQWEEAWGRIASEAHFSGVPCIAARRGGLPESVGEGGILIDPGAPVEDWVAAVRRLWDDDAAHGRLSAAALAYAMRDTLQPEAQLRKVTEVLARAVANARSGHAGAA